MSPLELDAFLQIVGTVAGVGGGLVALSLIMRYKLKRRELELHGAKPDLAAAVEDLRSEIQDTRQELGEMHERMDFAERLLTGRARGQQADL